MRNHAKQRAATAVVASGLALAMACSSGSDSEREAPSPPSDHKETELVTVRMRVGVWFGTGGVQATTSTLAETSSDDVVFTVRQTQRTIDDPVDPDHVASVDFDLGHGLHACLLIFAVGDRIAEGDRSDGPLVLAGELQGNWRAPRETGMSEDQHRQLPAVTTRILFLSDGSLDLWDTVHIDRGPVPVEDGGREYEDPVPLYQAFRQAEILGVGDDVPQAKEPLKFGPMPESCAERFGLVKLDGPDQLKTSPP